MASDGGRMRALVSLEEWARTGPPGDLSGQAGDLAGVALQAFQHGQDREGDGGGDGPRG
jgi:hypothetical protein